MKSFTIMALLALTLVGCTGKTQLGECVGMNDEKNPELVYEYDLVNIVAAVIFVETVIVPAVVVLEMLECPVGVKPVVKEIR